MHTVRSRRTAFLASVLVAAVCIVGVLVAVVRTGRDGSVSDWLAVVAVGALVVARRFYRRMPNEAG